MVLNFWSSVSVEEARELEENVAGQDAGEKGLLGEEPDFRIAVKKESLVGRGDLVPDFRRFPLDDIWLQRLFTLEMVEEDPWKGEEKGCGLGDSKWVVIWIGTVVNCLDGDGERA